MSRSLRAALLAALFVLACAGAPASVSAANGGLATGIHDPLFQTDQAAPWLQKAADARIAYAKYFVSWRSLTNGEPLAPRNPADPAYSFDQLDQWVQNAESQGLQPILGIIEAPAFAEGPGRPASVPAGTWKPKPAAIEDFMFALATRYSGSFLGLPRVEDFQLWSEQNLSVYLNPQWAGKTLFAADHYRAMLNAAFEGVHDASPGAKLITGGTAPYGEPPGGARSRPLRFWREVFCLKDRDKLKPTACGSPAERAHFDVMAHHPINTSGPPTQSAAHPDDASSADMDQIAKVLHGAEKAGQILPAGKHELWATEFWWESDPPDQKQGVPLKTQARYISESLYLCWKAGASLAVGLRVRDGDHGADKDGRIATGMYLIGGKAKPAVRAYSFPFVADRKKKSKKVALWGKAPGSGPVTIERKAGKGWKKLERLNAGSSRIFTGRTSLKGKAKLRAKASGEKSLVWNLK